MEKITIDVIGIEKTYCTGCFACWSICPQKAIEMIEDYEGFLYPAVNHDKCINCLLCRKTCPIVRKTIGE